MRLLLRSASLLALAASALSAHALTIYTRPGLWQLAASTGPTTLETFSGFSDGSFAGSTLDANGFSLVSLSPGPYAPDATIQNGRVGLFVSNTEPVGLEVLFPNPVYGFAADLTGANSGSGLRLLLNNGDVVDVNVNDGFFGFTTDSPFTRIEVVQRDLTTDLGEGFVIDNVRTGLGVPRATPTVPGPMAALPFALLALKRRKRA